MSTYPCQHVTSRGRQCQQAAMSGFRVCKVHAMLSATVARIGNRMSEGNERNESLNTRNANTHIPRLVSKL